MINAKMTLVTLGFGIVLIHFLLNGQAFQSWVPSVYAADITQEHTSDDGHASGGLPQFNPEYFPTQLFWLLLCFTFLYFLVHYIGLPRVAEIIEKREDRIAYDLDRVQELKNETDLLTRKIQHNLEQAQEQAQHILHDMAERVNKQRLEHLQLLENKIQNRLLESEQRIQEEKQIALSQTEDIAATLTVILIQTLSNGSMDRSQAMEVVKSVQQERADRGNL